MTQENAISNIGKGSFRGEDNRFSRVYLLWFSKGQFGPQGIDLNNNNIKAGSDNFNAECWATGVSVTGHYEYKYKVSLTQ